MESMTPQDSSDEIIKNIQSYNLQYSLIETPYFRLCHNQEEVPEVSSWSAAKSTLESFDLLEENSSLKNTIVDLSNAQNTNEDLIKDFDDKLEKAKHQ